MTFWMIFNGSGQGSGPEHDGQVRGLFGGEGPGDLGFAPADALLDHRGGIDVVVQDDGQALLHVFGGDLVEEPGPLGVKIQGNIGLVEIGFDAHAGVREDVSGHQGPPLQKKGPAGDDPGVFIGSLLIEDLVPRGKVALESLFQAVLIIHQLELQEGGPADQFDRPLRVLDAGKLDEDLIFPLGGDDRFGHAELVDPVPDRLQALADCRFLDGFGLFGVHLQEILELSVLFPERSHLQIGVLVGADLAETVVGLAVRQERRKSSRPAVRSTCLKGISFFARVSLISLAYLSMALSTAFWASTSRRRCIPPRRSSPRWIFSVGQRTWSTTSAGDQRGWG